MGEPTPQAEQLDPLEVHIVALRAELERTSRQLRALTVALVAVAVLYGLAAARAAAAGGSS